MKNSRRHK